MNLLKDIAALIIMGLLFVGLLYVVATVFVAGLIVAAIAAVWFTIRMYFLKRNIQTAVREYESTNFHSALRRDSAASQTDVIDVEYTEVEDASKDKTPR